MYGLFLNMMRDRAERVDLVAVADTVEALKSWENAQREVGEYSDGSTSACGHELRKTYRQGTPLEYYNPPLSMELGANGYFGEGVRKIPSREEWVSRAALEWDQQIATKRI